MYQGISFFSGIGGFELGLLIAGVDEHIQTTQFIECNPHAQRVLQKNFPGIPIHPDVRTYNPEGLDGATTVFYGGFPCQDISQSGKRRGIKEGTRSGLFFEFMRCVRVVRPRIIYLENVANLLSRAGGMDIVLKELSQAGYDAEWSVVSAADVGAVHKRDRVWIIAYPSGSASELEEYRSGGQGWQSIGASESAVLRQEHGETGTKGSTASDSLLTDSESFRRRTSGSEDLQGGTDSAFVLRGTEATNTSGKGLEGSQWQGLPGKRGQSEFTDDVAEPSDANSQRLARWQSQPNKQSAIAQSERQSRSLNGQSEIEPSVRGDDDGFSCGVDNPGRGIYLMSPNDLPQCLPFATDSDKIPYRKERLQELGNAVVPHVAAIGWRRVAELLGLRS